MRAIRCLAHVTAVHAANQGRTCLGDGGIGDHDASRRALGNGCRERGHDGVHALGRRVIAAVSNLVRACGPDGGIAGPRAWSRGGETVHQARARSEDPRRGAAAAARRCMPRQQRRRARLPRRSSPQPRQRSGEARVPHVDASLPASEKTKRRPLARTPSRTFTGGVAQTPVGRPRGPQPLPSPGSTLAVSGPKLCVRPAKPPVRCT